MKTTKKNIGSLTFKWKQKIKGNIGSYALRERERERERETCLIGMLRIIMVIGKMKEKEREYGYYGNRKMKKRGKGA